MSKGWKYKSSYDNFKRERFIGGHHIVLPEPPEITSIANYGLPVSEQKFKPREFPENFHELPDDYRMEYYLEEKRRSKEGYWFFNGGNLEYITGINYFYISYFKIKLTEQGKPKRMALPKFVDSDRDFFYVWDKAENDDKCSGLVFITNRRDGKSYKGGCMLYVPTIFNDDSHSGIQSRTEPDAKSVLSKVIDAWKRMPYIFRPKDTGDTNPAKSLRWSPSTKKDTKTKISLRRSGSNYINSFIDYGSSDSYAYDGQDLLRYMLDEAGKPQKSDVNETLRVVLETMMDGTDIVGKCFVTTTVEEMEKQTEDQGLKGIWKNANHEDLNVLGMTKNGMIRYFKPCFFGMRGRDENGIPFINEFGYTDWRRAKAYREKKREGLSGEALASEMRKYPFTIEEAFQSTQECYFDAAKINEHINYNNAYVNKDNLYRGDFHWKTDITNPEVYWQPDSEGKFYASYFPETKDRNKWTWVNTPEGKHRAPARVDIVGGADPFDHRSTVDGRSSDGSFHLFKKSGVWDGGKDKDPRSNSFIVEYIHRPPTPEEFYDDILKACVFNSARLLAETNRPGLVNYFRTNGYYAYLMKRPEQTHTKYSKSRTVERGIAMSGDVPRRDLPNRLMSYVFNEMGKDEEGRMKVFMPFNRTLDDWLKFNPNKWTEYDATVSSMLALVASDVDIKLKSDNEPILNLLPRYDNSGLVSKRVS